MYANISSFTLRGQQYEIPADISAPPITVVGVIFNIPEDDAPVQMMNSICKYNPKPAALGQWGRRSAAEHEDAGSISCSGSRFFDGSEKQKHPCVLNFSARYDS